MANQESIRKANLQAAFDILSQRGPVTRRQLQRLADLSWGAASGLVSLLQRKHLILPVGEAVSAAGPASTAFDLPQDRFLLIGLDISTGSGTTAESGIAVLSDLAGRTLRTAATPLPPTGDTLPYLLKIIQTLCQSLPPTEPRGIGLALDRPAEGAAEGAAEALHTQTGLPIAARDSAACAAIAHHRAGLARDTADFLLLRLSADLSLAAVVNGHPVQTLGPPFGHTILRPDGPRCACGQNGCLAAYASPQAILDRCREGAAMGLAPGIPNPRAASLTHVMNAAASGDAFCQAALGQAASYTGLALAAAIGVTHPACVLLTGELAAWPAYTDQVAAATERFAARRAPLDVRVASADDASAAVGAASLLARKVFWEAVEGQA